jgi:hypothetical protein
MANGRGSFLSLPADHVLLLAGPAKASPDSPPFPMTALPAPLCRRGALASESEAEQGAGGLLPSPGYNSPSK